MRVPLLCELDYLSRLTRPVNFNYPQAWWKFEYHALILLQVWLQAIDSIPGSAGITRRFPSYRTGRDEVKIGNYIMIQRFDIVSS